jgi:nucleoside-diphosphate-sugar epimerase
MPRALILGGTGSTGRATARLLLSAGWEVSLTGRDPARTPADIAAAGGTFTAADRSDAGRLAEVLGGGADLLVDCLCYGAGDATALLPLASQAASTVMISGKAVYADAAGRHANSADKPQFDGPVSETQPTVRPGGEGYGEGKVAAEQVLLDSGLPVTVIRPGLIHGDGARMPREWVFVKRVLDRRPRIFLAHPGAVNQTTAAANLAALIRLVAAKPGRRILNAADPDAPSALEIGRTTAGYLGHTWDEVLLDEPAGPVGRHPWQAPYPVVLDTAAAASLGYKPAGDYAATMTSEVDWLVRAAAGRAGQRVIGDLDDDFFAPMLDYAAEDRYYAGSACG